MSTIMLKNIMLEFPVTHKKYESFLFYTLSFVVFPSPKGLLEDIAFG